MTSCLSSMKISIVCVFQLTLILLIGLSLAKKTCQIICLQTSNLSKCTVCYEHCSDNFGQFQTISYSSCLKCKNPTCEDSQIFYLESKCFQFCFEKEKVSNQLFQKTRICQQDPKQDYKWGLIGGIIFIVVVLGVIFLYCLVKRIQICLQQRQSQDDHKNKNQVQKTTKEEQEKAHSNKQLTSTHKIIC